jgi:hypothetical protein
VKVEIFQVMFHYLMLLMNIQNQALGKRHYISLAIIKLTDKVKLPPALPEAYHLLASQRGRFMSPQRAQSHLALIHRQAQMPMARHPLRDIAFFRRKVVVSEPQSLSSVAF